MSAPPAGCYSFRPKFEPCASMRWEFEVLSKEHQHLAEHHLVGIFLLGKVRAVAEDAFHA